MIEQREQIVSQVALAVARWAGAGRQFVADAREMRLQLGHRHHERSGLQRQAGDEDQLRSVAPLVVAAAVAAGVYLAALGFALPALPAVGQGEWCAVSAHQT